MLSVAWYVLALIESRSNIRKGIGRGWRHPMLLSGPHNAKLSELKVIDAIVNVEHQTLCVHGDTLQ